MCRWIAYRGETIPLEHYVTAPAHSLIEQSIRALESTAATNGDGFGLGWYGTGDGPGLYRSLSPAWGDDNLRELAAHIESPLFVAHVRAAIGSPVQESNCHPFRRGDWLFVHNGFIADFHELRRDLMLAIDPGLFADVRGSTDTEVVFYLALTHGLESDPVGALEQTVGLMEASARRHGLAPGVQGTFGVTNGESLWAVRYASEGTPRSLFASKDVETIKHLQPDNPRLERLRDDDRVIVSEPFSDLPGMWQEIPPSSSVAVHRGGGFEERPFEPRDVPEPAAV
jgi:predicted glutamine amidotransferase